jgi:hypothetical protein
MTALIITLFLIIVFTLNAISYCRDARSFKKEAEQRQLLHKYKSSLKSINK